MLKSGIVMMGLALACAISVPREFGGLIGTFGLLVAGMVLVIVSPRLREYHDRGIRQTEDGPTPILRPSQPELPDYPVRRGRHAKDRDS